MGAIYTGRDYSHRGNRIRHNFIHETGGFGMGSMGVYMDDCVSGTEIFQDGAAQDGFRLPQESPAWKLGFQAIPFDQIGPRANADRRRLERLR